MIKKLRLKFIALSMGLLFLVLALIMGLVNILNYRAVVADADAVLEILTENGGAFPNFKDLSEKEFRRTFSPELPYESRYFSVHLDSLGGVVFSNTGKIAAVDTETAIAYAETVWAGGRADGFLGDYRFARQAGGDGSLIVFLDCGRRLHDARDFLLISCGIALSGFALVFLLCFFLSGRVVKPFSENYEKQKRFITDAGHELKTPLTIIDADAAVLELDIGENEWLRDIQTQTKHLSDLTGALILLARTEEEPDSFQRIDFPLSDVVAETAQSFQAPAVAQGKTLTVDIQPMLSLRGDEKALRQLTGILLENALKYSGAAGQVFLRLKSAGRTIQLSVENTTAAPVDPAALDRLFDRFYRADESRSTAAGGYGIGLSIARAITAAHKGTIRAAAPEAGTFRITAAFPA